MSRCWRCAGASMASGRSSHILRTNGGCRSDRRLRRGRPRRSTSPSPLTGSAIAKVKVGWDTHRLQVAVKADRARYAARMGRRRSDLQVKHAERPARALEAPMSPSLRWMRRCLQLAPNDSWDVLTAMMGDRPLSVLTSTAQMQVDRQAALRPQGARAGRRRAAAQAICPVSTGRISSRCCCGDGHVPLDAERPRACDRAAVGLASARSSSSRSPPAARTSFGMGSTRVRTAQDLSVYSGIPPLVRSGDRICGGVHAAQWVRARAMKVTATVDLSARASRSATRSPPPSRRAGAVPIAWEPHRAARVGHAALARHRAFGRRQGGRPGDGRPAGRAAGADAGLGFGARLAPNGGTIPIAPPVGGDGRTRFGRYPAERHARPAHAGRAPSSWPSIPTPASSSACRKRGRAGECRIYGLRSRATCRPIRIPDGLIRYFPSDTLAGSESLTAYVMSIAAQAGTDHPRRAARENDRGDEGGARRALAARKLMAIPGLSVSTRSPRSPNRVRRRSRCSARSGMNAAGNADRRAGRLSDGARSRPRPRQRRGAQGQCRVECCGPASSMKARGSISRTAATRRGG